MSFYFAASVILILIAVKYVEINDIIQYWYFTLLGIVGAIVANSTGAGGGVVFMPFFVSLGVDSTQALGTSILIQSFGMTAGSIAWLSSSRVMGSRSIHIHRLAATLLILCGVACVLGVLSGQYLLQEYAVDSVVLFFKLFSVFFGLVLVSMVLFYKQYHTRFHADILVHLVLFLATFIGGIITAWISVGVGEVVAVALMLMRYPTLLAVTIGVCMSSISVLTAAYQHAVIMESVNWHIVLFAAPGALLGGSIAYKVSEYLGATRLKLLFGIWIVFTGISM